MHTIESKSESPGQPAAAARPAVRVFASMPVPAAAAHARKFRNWHLNRRRDDEGFLHFQDGEEGVSPEAAACAARFRDWHLGRYRDEEGCLQSRDGDHPPGGLAP